MVVVFTLDVLIAAMVEGHPDHARCAAWLRRAKNGEATMLVAQPTVTDLFAALTVLPVRPRISPAMAGRLVHGNIDPSQVIAVSPAVDWAVLERATRNGVRGRDLTELVAVHAAQMAGADHVVSLESKALSRVPDIPSGFVITP